MSQSKWNKPIKQYETKIKEYDDEIKELTLKQKNLQKRVRGLKRLKSGNNIHFISDGKQDRYKILWLGKSYWFHLPKHDYEKSVMKIRSDFINKILQGEIL